MWVATISISGVTGAVMVYSSGFPWGCRFVGAWAHHGARWGWTSLLFRGPATFHLFGEQLACFTVLRASCSCHCCISGSLESPSLPLTAKHAWHIWIGWTLGISSLMSIPKVLWMRHFTSAILTLVFSLFLEAYLMFLLPHIHVRQRTSRACMCFSIIGL